ncbi:MAG: enoyl-CoA hydratase/isomerase family protein [Candidatus Heimdallarchaeota archaeon]
MKPEADTVKYLVREQVATISLNRPKKRNALRMMEFDQLIHYISEANRDDSVHVIRISSSGDRAFSAGLDLNMIQELTLDTVPQLLEYGYNLVRTMIRSKKPIVVQVQGPAVAWGTIICLAADFVIAGDNPKTFFGLPEIDLGMFPATGALTMALFNTDLRKARKILLIPERTTVDDAAKLGLVTKTCSLDKLEETTIKFCQSLAEKSQSIMIPIRALINKFYLDKLENFFKVETEAFYVAMEGDKDKLDEFIQKLWKSSMNDWI